MELLTPSEAKSSSMVDISPPSPALFELRVIIWAVKNVTIKGKLTHANDLYVTGHLDLKGQKRQKTDTHFRSHDGVGNFNWYFFM